MAAHNILEAYPEYESTSRLDDLRKSEYGYLDEHKHIYLDYTGSGLAARSQYRAHESRLSGGVFGNPHSTNPSSQAATDLVDSARARVLKHFNASPDEYVAIFTQNASGAARLIGESYPFSSQSKLVLTFDNHNSVNGLREFARSAGAKTSYISAEVPELRINTGAVMSALTKPKPKWRGCGLFPRRVPKKSGLFAYPAQSNFSGVRHPLSWVPMAQAQGYDVLLDAAAYVPTAPLDLSEIRPEFVIVSWYKVFGYPTGVGCLIAQKDALARLQRPWFSGGTVLAAIVGNGMEWHLMNKNEAAFEDGTVNFLSIPDVEVGLDWIADLGMQTISRRVQCLTGWLLDRLLQLQHDNGVPMARLYGPKEMKMRGGTVCFNFIDISGKVVDERLVAMESAAAGISLRTGCFCNPGGGENAFGLDEKNFEKVMKARPSSPEEAFDLLGLASSGAVRVSLGLASTAEDVEMFLNWAETTYKNRSTSSKGLPPRGGC